MPAFDEVQFPVSIALGAAGGPGFSTDLVILSSGFEARNQNWAEARYSFDVASGIKNDADMAVFIAFFNVRRGRARGFRFKDWKDFSATSAVANGMQGVMQNTVTGLAVGDGSTRTFQLQKSYASGGVTYLRTIKKPISSGLIAYKDGVSATFTLDTTTGILTFTTAPGNGVVPTWAGQFDVPVRFDIDKLDVAIENMASAGAFLSNISKIPIIEDRQP